MNEFELIGRFFSRPPRDASVHLAIGDDAALLAPTPGCEIVASVDMLVADRHFRADADPEGVGHKTLAVNLSDMAAMGARPRWALLACSLPEADAAWVGAFARGFTALADAHGVDLVGGDTTRGPRNLCVTILGEVPNGTALLRSGAQAGDDIYVSGTLGEAALAVEMDSGRAQVPADARTRLRERLDRPQPRVALGMALRGVAHAALDISDGLVGDLGHILERSGVSASIALTAIPRSTLLGSMLEGTQREVALRCMLAGGDDYELCFTAPVRVRDRIDAIATRIGIELTRIGRIGRGAGLVVRDEQERVIETPPAAFDHFAAR